jgi:hypothetical protein
MQTYRCPCGNQSTFLPCEDCKAKSWAKAQGYSVASRSVCIGQLLRRHVCRMGNWGKCEHPPGVDHSRLFLDGRKPAVFVSEPYPGPDVARLLEWCKAHGLTAEVSGESWHGFGCLHIRITVGVAHA